MASSAAENRKKLEDALNRNATIAGSNPNRGLPARPVSPTALGKLARAQQQARMQPTYQPGNTTQPIVVKPQVSPGIYKAKTEKIPTPKGLPDLPTSKLPAENPLDPIAPPPPGETPVGAEKKVAERYRNFQRLRAAQRKQQIQNLTNIQRLGYNAANVVKRATGPAVDRVASR
jgi:hypothetical protein